MVSLSGTMPTLGTPAPNTSVLPMLQLPCDTELPLYTHTHRVTLSLKHVYSAGVAGWAGPAPALHCAQNAFLDFLLSWRA